MHPTYMHFSRRATTAISIVIVAIVLIAWFILRPANPLPQTYRNSRYSFTLRLPSDYTITETPNTNPREENGTADIIEFAHASGNIQLTITYASYASPELTTQSVLSNFPSISGIQTQPFPIAPTETGLALHGDPAHPDQVSGVWFAKNGLLYQLTAYGDGFNELLPIADSLTLF